MIREAGQLLVNGIISGAEIGLAAVGFNIVFAVLKSSNFAVGSLMTTGAYAGLVANVVFGLPMPIAALIGFLIAGTVGAASDYIVMRPLRSQGHLTVAIASMALSLILENVLRFFFSNEFRGYDVPVMRDIAVLGIRVPPLQLQNLGIAIVVMIALMLLLTRTPIGKAMRAVADNPRLADIKGINSGRIAIFANFLGLGLAGVAGVMIGVNTAVDPVLGFRVLLAVFAAAVLGGLGSIPGALVGSALIGIGEEVSLLFAPPAFRTVTGFIVIVFVLLVMPRGLSGFERDRPW